MRRACLVVLAAAACGGSQVTASESKPPVDLAKLLPATLEATHAKQGEPRAVHVRAWADAGVRASPRWKEAITEQIDYASQLLTPLLGIRLALDEIKPWDRTGEPEKALAALAQVDDAKEVTWVIGYVVADDTARKALPDLAGAELLGHYVTVRDWATKPETDALAERLTGLTPAQRAEVLAAHQRHKQAVILLHGLAVTLGAIAEADPTWVMHPLYSAKQATFSDRDRELMQLAIDERLGGGANQAIAHDLLEAIVKQDWGGWIPTDHDDVVKQLRNVVDAGKEGKTAADVPASAYEQFDRIRELAKRGEGKEALLELDGLLVAYPGNATMHELRCELLLAKTAASAQPKKLPPRPDAATLAACARVGELAPGDPSPYLAIGEALIHAGDLEGGRKQLVEAATRIGNLPSGATEAWKKLVAIYAAIGALTWTEDVLEAGKLAGDPATAAIATTRVRYGVPRGAKFVKPEAEGALVTATKDALALVNANKFGDAERALAAADKKWPGAPGLAGVRCDLLFRQGQTDAARAACARALAADGDESWALYLAGVIALRDTGAAGTAAGIEKLKKAIAVDPDLGPAWRALGRAYARAKDQPALDELGKAYATKFSQPLPP